MLFTLGHYIYRASVTNLPLTPAGVWHFYDGRTSMERRTRERHGDFALPKTLKDSFAANALYLEIVRLAYNLSRHFSGPAWNPIELAVVHFAGTPFQSLPASQGDHASTESA